MFFFEMHQHTSPCSHCGRANPEIMVNEMKNEGLSGCVITDHFYHGNTGIDRDLSWNEFCKPYEDAYRMAKAAGEKIDFDVLFGIEEHIGEGKEVLIYGVEPEFMYEHPEMRNCSLEHLYSIVKDAGGLLIQAHPFRSRDYIPNPYDKLPTEFLDGYEIWNSANKEEDNLKAEEYGKTTGKILTAGSDSHRDSFAWRSGIISKVRIKDGKELVDVLKKGDYSLKKELAE